MSGFTHFIEMDKLEVDKTPIKGHLSLYKI